MIIITLGTCCETSLMISKIYPEQLRYPFDWLSIHSPETIISILENDFKSFTEFYDIHSKCYDFHSPHHIPLDTLKRRVARFKEVMDKDEFILFILKFHISPMQNVKEEVHYFATNWYNIDRICKLRDVLVKQKKGGNILLLVVNERKRVGEEEYVVESHNLKIDWLTHENVPVHCSYELSEQQIYDKLWKNITDGLTTPHGV